MAMQITRRSIDHIPILDLSGPFVVWTDPERTTLRTPVSNLVSEGQVNVLIHLGRVTDIDAQGVGELAWGVTMMQRSGGRMALIAPRRRVRQLLALTRLDTLLAIYDSERDAIAEGFGQIMTPPTRRYTSAA
jgi:anti-anti-sigma factor